MTFAENTAYNRYIDERMPETHERERIRRTRERPKRKSAVASEGSATLTSGEFRQIVTALLIIGVLFIGTLFLNAYATNIQYNINSLTKQNLQLENDIKTLELKINTGTSIEMVETYAVEKLGMSYPKAEQCVYINAAGAVPDNFVDILRKKAYE